MVIALDAGHDNSNPGYSGIITEYEYTSKMVDKLNTFFKEDNHFEVILTHNTDEDMPLGKRVEAIKKLISFLQYMLVIVGMQVYLEHISSLNQ